MSNRYRKKPVIIEAIKWTGSNWNEIVEWGCACAQDQDNNLLIPTLEGVMYASPGDMVIRGIKDEIYPCKPDIFEQTYEIV